MTDALLSGVFVAATLAESLTSDTASPAVVHALLAVPAMVLLAWRRRFPLSVGAAVMGANFAINPDGEFSTLLALVLVSFTLGSELSAPRNWLGLGLVFVPFITGMTFQGLQPSDVAAATVFLVGPWTVGLVMRQRAQNTTEALARAARLERDREAENEAVAAQERVRIARELHDVVSHSISVVAIQTQAVRRRLGPGNAREAADLAAVETTARQALAEMRRIFGALRSNGESPLLMPQPGLGELERLLAQVRSAGLPVDLRVMGERVELPPGVDLAAFRIVQEGLTNALRHASANQASVSLRFLPTVLEVAVEDDGSGPSSPPGGPDGGHGLVGVRERVALYGGTVEFGPADGAGTRLAATLPVREPT